jgi:hypothetical protein
VLATHIDREHIHNHIIVNNVNFYTGKTFETEYNQGKIPDRAWSKLRQISDNLCKKHYLSVIDFADQTKGKSHWEWQMDQQNMSWKAKLKSAIDKVVTVSENFEDFLQKCAEFGVLVDYNPDHKIDLKFMLAEQKERNPRAKFTRAKTLGWFYESKQIAMRIENYKYFMSYTPKAKIIRTTSEKFLKSEGLTNWADRENMKEVSKALNEINASNSTLKEIETAAQTAMAKYMVLSTPMQKLSDRFHEIEEQIPVVEKYSKYLKFKKKYNSLEGREKKKFAKNYEYELSEFSDSFQKMKSLFPDGKAPTLKNLQDEMQSIREEYQKLHSERADYKKEADRLGKLAQKKRDNQRTLEAYVQNEEGRRKKDTLE